MSKVVTKRDFLAGSLAAFSVLAISSSGCTSSRAVGAYQPGAVSGARRARTEPVFRCPKGFPNGMAKCERGIWVGEQKLLGEQALSYNIPEPDDATEHAWLLDWRTGNVLDTVRTQSRNTSGLAYGDGYIWMMANSPPYGVFQTDLNSNTISHRQVPLGGGGNHGGKFKDGKLWIVSTRLGGILRVDPTTWEPEFMIPYSRTKRHHDMAFDDEGTIWLITGDEASRSWREGRFGLDRYDAETGALLESVEFIDGSADPHGLEFHDGALYTCDAGIHPGWPTGDSPYSGYMLRIDFV